MNSATIEIIGSGEEVRYTDGSQTVIAGIYTHGTTTHLEAYAVRSWDTPRGVALTEAERHIVIDRIARYLKTCMSRVIIDQQAPPPAPQTGPIGRDVWAHRKKHGFSSPATDQLL